MPIYAYKCSACGHAEDVLQKMSDPLLTVCPNCGQSTYVKQVTAAGFQLKGTGWYVTDFRNNGAAPSKDGASSSSGSGEGASKSSSPTESSGTSSSGSGSSTPSSSSGSSTPNTSSGGA